VEDFLSGLQLDHLHEICSEHITMDVLVDMTHKDLQSIGITVLRHRHRILRTMKELAQVEVLVSPGWPIHSTIQGVVTPIHAVLTQLRPDIWTLYTKEGVELLRFLPYIIGSKDKICV